MLIEGIVERIDGATVSGWVRCSSKEDRVIVRLFVESIAVAEVEANQVRSDLTTKISVGFGYRCTADVVRAYFGKCPNLEVVAECGGKSIALPILPAVDLARELSNWTVAQQRNFALHLSGAARSTIADALLHYKCSGLACNRWPEGMRY